MSETLVLEFDELIRSVKISKNETFTILLGAGASISSGIQSAQDCIWEWKKDIYMSKNTNAPEWIENYKVEQVREILQKWLDSEGSYLPLGHEDEYSFYIEKCYRIEDDRRKYFQRICKKKEPSIGYKLLCLLAEQAIIQSVWTTNFDNLTLKAANIMNITAIDVTLDCIDRIIRPQNSSELLHIGLHGDYRYGPLKNTSSELIAQDETFRQKLVDYLNDKHLIVLGYSGRDRSLMDALIESYSKKGSGRIYWCGYGQNINDNTKKLLEKARENGRTAYFVPTDGFDKTMIKLSKVCLKDNDELYEKVQGLLSKDAKEFSKTPFTIDITHINTINKSNSFPLNLPKEVYQFETNFNKDEKRWATIKELSKDSNITAVPYKEFVWAFGTLNDIQKCFNNIIKGKVNRKPLTDLDLLKDTAIYHLLISSLTKVIAYNSNLSTNGKDLLWVTDEWEEKVISGVVCHIHKAIKLSINSDGNYYLTLNPDFYISGVNAEISDDIRKEVGKYFFEKLWNRNYNDYINNWRKIIFVNNVKVLEVEYPLNSGTGFVFELRNIPAFAQIMKAGTYKGITLNTKFPKSSIKYTGIQYTEPMLIFSSKHPDAKEKTKDFHPIRGLNDNRPYDYPLNGKILSNEISLGVVCPKTESQSFYRFINEHQNKVSTKVNKEYLIDYPGFFNAYGVSLNIPTVSSENWSFCPEPNGSDIKSTTLDLARKIREQIEYLVRDGKNIVILIFIPKRWEYYLDYCDETEQFDLHDYIKAICAEKGVATQFIKENTIESPLELRCQIHWWLSLSYYVKSLRTPWILNTLDKDTAFAGLGYSVNHRNSSEGVILGCSHIYNSQGQGLRYKLSKIEDSIYWDKQKSPHLSYDDAFQFGLTIKELFYSAMNCLPRRVVVHKRTFFTNNEISGIRDSLLGNGIEKLDLIEINFESDIRFIASRINNEGMPNEADSYAIPRGTCILLNSSNSLLWTHGVVPSVRNEYHRYYLGGRYIPTPLRIKKYFGESNIGQVANEILGLTKMNWNTFDLYTQLPATLNSSIEIARIGRLLSRREGATYDYRYFI